MHTDIKVSNPSLLIGEENEKAEEEEEKKK